MVRFQCDWLGYKCHPAKIKLFNILSQQFNIPNIKMVNSEKCDRCSLIGSNEFFIKRDSICSRIFRVGIMPQKTVFSYWHWPCSVCEYWAKWRKHTNKDPFQSCKSHRRTLIKSSTTNPGPKEVPLWLLLMSLPTQWDLHSRRMEAVCSPRGIDISRNWTEDICGVLEVTRAIWFYWGWLLRIRFIVTVIKFSM